MTDNGSAPIASIVELFFHANKLLLLLSKVLTVIGIQDAT